MDHDYVRATKTAQTQIQPFTPQSLKVQLVRSAQHFYCLSQVLLPVHPTSDNQYFLFLFRQP